ncbi:hypothetical protein BD779DRAFT_1150238 [Infundibulicybe gibba]|nr:hypothetical protein BD779DRAFT_1150238 [Infundibulicybe gibba]
MTTNLPPIPPNVGASTGPLLLGYLFNWGLYGILSVQVYLYYLAFPKDRLSTKCLVFGTYLVETIQTILITHDIYDSFGSGFGNLTVLGSIQLEWLGVPIISGIVACAVQIFFAYRIFILSRSKLLGSVVCVIAVTQCGAGIAQGIQALQLHDFSNAQTKAFVSCIIWGAGSAGCDIIITISMTYYLSKTEASFKSGCTWITRLIWLTIGTGAMTAVVATVGIALFLAFPQKTYFQTSSLIQAKLYSNTLVVIFNSRIRLVDGRDMTQPVGLIYFSPAWTDEMTGGSKPPRHQTDQSQLGQDGTRQIEITVNTFATQQDDWSDNAYPGQSERTKTITLGDETSKRMSNSMA